MEPKLWQPMASVSLAPEAEDVDGWPWEEGERTGEDRRKGRYLATLN